MLATTMTEAWQRREASGCTVAGVPADESVYDEICLSAIANGGANPYSEDFGTITIVLCTTSIPPTFDYRCGNTYNCA